MPLGFCDEHALILYVYLPSDEEGREDSVLTVGFMTIPQVEERHSLIKNSTTSAHIASKVKRGQLASKAVAFPAANGNGPRELNP